MTWLVSDELSRTTGTVVALMTCCSQRSEYFRLPRDSSWMKVQSYRSPREGKEMLDDKAIIVTGVGSGVGQAAARLFAEAKATLVLADPNRQKGQPFLSKFAVSSVIAYPGHDG
jgi:hypothetical protein